MSFPVVVNSLRLGDVWIRYDRGNSPLIAKAALIDILTPLFGSDAATMAQLEAMPEKDGSVTLARLQQAGFSVRFDARRLELQRVAGTAAVAAPPPVPTQQSPRRERALNVVVPLKGGGTLLGEVPMQVLSDHSVQIPKAALIDILTPYLEDDDAALSRLQNVPDVDGQVTTEALKAAGFDVLFDRKIVEINNVGRGEGKPPKSETPRVNSTGKSIAISVPVKDGDLELGDITVQIAPDSTVRVPKPALAQLLAGVFNKAEIAKLESVPDTDGKVALGDLAAAQLDIRYDPGLQEIVVRPGNGQRLANEFSVASSRIKAGGGVVKPASFSGYVNVTGGADYLIEGRKAPSMYLDLQSAARMGGIVVENAGIYVGEIDPNVCPAYAQCTYSHEAGFKRQSSRIVYDNQEQQTRLQLGDFNMPGTAIQGANDVAGISFQKTARIFAPGESIRPSGNGSFSLDRAADVDVQVNGVTVQHLRLRPGSYNFRDLPLTSGSNDVLLVITDDAGVRRSIPFTMFSGDNMIAAGKSEWAVNGGLASFYRDGERSYETGHLLANAFYRYGLTDTLTLDAQAKGDQYATMGGMGFVTATAIGTWGLQGALSNSSAGIGLAANVNWDLINFRGVIGSFSDAAETVRVAAEYRDQVFRSPGKSIINASGVLYPQYPYWLRLTGAYTVPIAGHATATLAGRYQLADDKALSLTPNTVGAARFGADVTLAAPLTSWASGSVSAGYSNETYLRHMSGDQSDAPDMRIMLTLNVHPNEKTRLATTYDSLTRTESASAHAISQSGLDRWETDLNLIQNGDQQNANATGSIGYYGNRGEMRLSQSSGFASPSIEKYQLNPGDQRTSVRVTSALAFADGHFAVGQPIRGNGFAIVYPHESIADKELAVGEGAAARARSGPLGPALVPDLPPTREPRCRLTPRGLPLGYSLGTGAFEVAAPYRGRLRATGRIGQLGLCLRNALTQRFDPVGFGDGCRVPGRQSEQAGDGVHQQNRAFRRRRTRTGALDHRGQP